MAVNISGDDVRAAADIAVKGSRYQSVGRVVAICARSDFPFALARMWQVLVRETRWQTHVFRDRAEALSWIKERVGADFDVHVNLGIEC
jgi:hypothetical protein